MHLCRYRRSDGGVVGAGGVGVSAAGDAARRTARRPLSTARRSSHSDTEVCLTHVTYTVHSVLYSVAEWIARPTAVSEDRGSNHAADGRVYRDSCCDIQPWVRAVHLYCSAYVDSAFHSPWAGKMSISIRAEQ